MTKRSGQEFLVEVVTLSRQPGSRRRVQIEGEIPELDLSAARVPEGALVHLDVVLEAVSGGILVTGSVESTWVGECRRCLEQASGVLRAEVRELAMAEPDEEEMTYPLGRAELDLRPIAHDACILELPLAPLCQEDCRGLCPSCGVNRNRESCSCEPALDGRFAALALLSGNGDEQGPEGRQDRDD